MNSLCLSARWRGRTETAGENAIRLAEMLRGLAEIDDCFGAWYKKGKSLKSAQRPAWTMPPDIDELARVLDKSSHRNLDGQITDMALGAWNGSGSGFWPSAGPWACRGGLDAFGMVVA